jgi:hypothetical protein
MRSSRILPVVLILLLTMFLFNVIPVYAANVTNVALSTASGPPGTVVTISGSGFSAADYTVTMGGITVVPTTAVVGGSISANFAIPTLPRTGTPYPVVVTAGADIVNTPYFTITPAVWLSSASGNVADVVKVSGYGFFGNTTIQVSFDGTDILSTTSDASGMFTNLDVTVPQSKGGWHTIAARDYIGSSPGVVYVISPKINLSTTSGQTGSSVVCSGNGFVAISSVSFSLDTLSIAGTALTDANGTFSSTTLTIPAISGGGHTFKAQDASGNSAVSSLSVTSAISISPPSGTSGTLVTITGSGFQANGTLSITYNGAQVVTNPPVAQSNSNGGFTTSFNVPALPAGLYDVAVSDSVSTATAKFISSAAAAINMEGGVVGTNVTVSGTGFRPRGEVTVRFDDVMIGTGSSDIYGNFTVKFSVPSSSTGEHQVLIDDKTNSLTFMFRVTPDLNINPASGYVDSDIQITATGFGSENPVTINYDSDLLASGNTDIAGTFSITVKAPVSEGGNHTISATDSINILSSGFAMDATPPGLPEPLFPAPLTKADKAATFSWKAVSDPSSVTYSLQIAANDSFSTLVLQKHGLTSAQYTLTAQDVLKSVSKKTPYYWRVKAIDRAFNESPWSSSSTFYMGFVLADWALYIVFGIVALLCGVVGFLLGIVFSRRRSLAKQVQQ